MNKKSIKKAEVEDIVLKCVYDFLDSLSQVDLSNAIKKGVLNNCNNEEKELINCEQKINEVNSNIEVLKNEVIKSLTGESSFSSDLLNELINEKEIEKIKLLNLKEELNNKMNQKKLKEGELLQIKNKIPVWKKEFEKADLDVKKMLLSEIIKEIRVFNDRYEIDFRLELNDYIKQNIQINSSSKTKICDKKLVEDTISIKLSK